jgi:hypothetical protein
MDRWRFTRIIRNKTRRIRSFCLVVALGLTASIPLAWLVFADGANLTGDVPEKGIFQFVRLRYTGAMGPLYYKNWYTDFPNMDRHLTLLMKRLTGIDVGRELQIPPSSPEIFGYPMVYSVEPEQIVFSAKDVENMREYLARGGLWFADDFHGDGEFNAFLRQIRKVLPDAMPVELDVSHPLFHAFYDIDKIIQVTNNAIAECHQCDQWENGPTGRIPKVFAIFGDSGRISVLMAWNTDLGDGLEWADDPKYPEYYSKYAFKFVTNVIVYAMTH